MRCTLQELKKLKSFKKLKRFLCKERAYTEFHRELVREANDDNGSLAVDGSSAGDILGSFTVWSRTKKGIDFYRNLYNKSTGRNW